MLKLITICWFGLSDYFSAYRYVSERCFIREHPFTMWTLNIWIISAPSNQIAMIVWFIFIISKLIRTLIPLIHFGALISRIKMYTLFPLHHSSATTTNFIFLSQIRLLSLYSCFGDLFRLFYRSMSVIVVVPEGLLSVKLSCRLLPHYRPLVWTQFFIEATSAVDLLWGGSCWWTAMRSPLMRLLISKLWRWFGLIDDVFAFRDVTLGSYYKSLKLFWTYWDCIFFHNEGTRHNDHNLIKAFCLLQLLFAHMMLLSFRVILISLTFL